MSSPAICQTTDGKTYHISYLCKQKKLTGTAETTSGDYRFILTGDESHLDTSEQARFDKISDWAMDVIQPDSLICIEDYAFNAKGRVHSTGENTGLLKHKLYKAGHRFETVPPLKLKKFAEASRIKGTTSTKDLMEQRFIEVTGIDLRGFYGLGEKVKNPISDIIDSFWLCEYLRAQCVKK